MKALWLSLGLLAGFLLIGAGNAAEVPRVMPRGPAGMVRGVVDSVHPKDHLVIIDDRGYRLGDTYRLNGVSVPSDSRRLRPGMRVKIELAPPLPKHGGMPLVRGIRTEGAAR